jgi:ABC-type nitrate/sulfonate/bicarbonate transport system substrate-binding protein
VVRPPITTPDGLRGKTFGIQSFGGPPHIRTLAALMRLGVDPERDGVTIIITGDGLVTAAARLEGATDGAAISYTAAADLKARGYHACDVAALGIPEVTGIVARSGLLRDRAEATHRLPRALAAANTYVRTIGGDAEARRRVGKVVGERLRTPPDRVLLQLDQGRDHLPADLRLSLDEALELQSLTAMVSLEVRDMRVEDWLQQGHLDQL